MAKSYYEKLQDPRWQRKRLEIMQRDNFRCLRCGSSTKTLTIHHVYYDQREPWDYPEHAYQTLCKDGCHQHVQQLQVQVFECVAKLGVSQLELLVERLKDVISRSNPDGAMGRMLELLPSEGDPTWRDKVCIDKKNAVLAQLAMLEAQERGGR